MMRRYYLSVEVSVPEETTRMDIINAVRDGIATERGYRSPADPISELDRDTIVVRYIRDELPSETTARKRARDAKSS